MACAGCRSEGKTVGCNNNGDCKAGGCNKLNVFDWLSNMKQSNGEVFDIMEVRFKNGRKDFYRNDQNLEVIIGDPVVVDVPSGHHIGYVSLQGELVRLQMKKKNVDQKDVRSIYRSASSKDLEKYDRIRSKEESTMYRSREILQNLKLQMKLTDVEFQADNGKATFYYSAEERVDFRELIVQLAAEFHVRVEMRQINSRLEASRIGGIGSCGRELCCSIWLTNFKTVPTSAARYQNLSLNPSKLSGQCGRLKCCLNYELDTYKEVLSNIPKVETPLQTEKGAAFLQKTDIFKKIMWFGYKDDHNWHAIPVDRVENIIELNKAGEKPATLFEDELFENTQENSKINADLEAMDRKFNKGKKKKKNKNRNKKRRQHNKNPEQKK
ncbi:MAG: Signal peptidase-like protein [Cytophagales bacterium]|nr:Signal peptidase-like protein [Cytophagales bacterium]